MLLDLEAEVGDDEGGTGDGDGAYESGENRSLAALGYIRFTLTQMNSLMTMSRMRTAGCHHGPTMACSWGLPRGLSLARHGRVSWSAIVNNAGNSPGPSMTFTATAVLRKRPSHQRPPTLPCGGFPSRYVSSAA